ncbi:MAG: serine protease [Gemmataceae bacterium]|nr:serine protease [Gemmataceae bacterium]
MARLLILLLVLAGCSAKPAGPPVGPVPQGPPPAPDRFVFSPRLVTGVGETEAGTAFAAKLDGADRPLIVTCLHIFGTTGGLPRDIPAGDLPRQVRKVGLSDRFTGAAIGEATQVIPLPGAKPLGEPSDTGDIVALWAPAGAEVKAAPFARGAMPPGSPVWMVGRLPTDRGASAVRLHKARVEGMRDGLLTYRFEGPAIELRATSGAPVVDGDGAIVGIHVGGEKLGTQTMGAAVPVETFLPKLKEAAAKHPAK